ncbi:MAG: hypothetical protein KF691_07730 [Phycisphaeraceae bacterium]|nr:hypothetical protein [Phycisphaeraceae bacterium]
MSNVFSSSYPISRSPGVCAASGRAFLPGERVVATLSNRDEEFVRTDFSSESWTGGARPTGLFAHWTTVFQPGADARKTKLSDEEASELFEQLDNPQTPAQEAFRFVLALFLVRRRLFVYEGSKDGMLRVRARTRADEIQAPVVEVREVSMKDESLAGALDQLKELIPDPVGQA